MNKTIQPFITVLICFLLFNTALAGQQMGQVALPGTMVKVALKRVFASVGFQRPLAMLQAPGNERDFYVVEQGGRILRVSKDQDKVSAATFIDIQDRVESGPNEAGLLGLAFDPAFAENGQVYLSYTRRGTRFGPPLISVVSRFISTDQGLSLDPDSEQILLKVEQPYGNHNGGNIAFGPDGYLYLGLGDGGSGGDPHGHGQNTETLLGALLRMDVKTAGGGLRYGIPADNPFVGKPGRDEIYAFGLRNPWRWSFDRANGRLWLADVGQNHWEEINIIQKGANYGWGLREGAHCYTGDCERAGLSEPVAEYSHDAGCSVTGGYVYRGGAIPGLQGVYLFGDFCSGRVWGLWRENGGGYEKKLLLQADIDLASFAEDRRGEIYLLDLKGQIYVLRQE